MFRQATQCSAANLQEKQLLVSSRGLKIELPKNNNNTDNNSEPEEIIKIKNPKSRQQLITFQYSRERHIDITLTNENQNHWAIRAIKYGQTTLSDCELTDFVRRIKDRTF